MAIFVSSVSGTGEFDECKYLIAEVRPSLKIPFQNFFLRGCGALRIIKIFSFFLFLYRISIFFCYLSDRKKKIRFCFYFNPFSVQKYFDWWTFVYCEYIKNRQGREKKTSFFFKAVSSRGNNFSMQYFFFQESSLNPCEILFDVTYLLDSNRFRILRKKLVLFRFKK